MKSLQAIFDSFVLKCYGPGVKEIDPVTGPMYSDLRDAFFAGCLEAYQPDADHRDELMRYRAAINERLRSTPGGVKQ